MLRAFSRFQIEGLIAREGAEEGGAGNGQIAASNEAAQETHARKRQGNAEARVEEGDESVRHQTEGTKANAARHHDVTGSIEETPEGDFILNVASDTIRVFTDHLREDLDMKHSEYSIAPMTSIHHMLWLIWPNERIPSRAMFTPAASHTMPAMKSNAVFDTLSIGTSFQMQGRHLETSLYGSLLCWSST